MLGRTNPEDILPFGNQNNKGPAKKPPTKQEIQAKKEEQKQVDGQRTNAIKHHREIIQQRKKNIAQGKIVQNTVTPDKQKELFYDPFSKGKSPYTRDKTIPEPKAVSEAAKTPAKAQEKNIVQQKQNIEASSKKSLKQSSQYIKAEVQDDVKSNKTGKLQRSTKKPEVQQKIEIKTQRFSRSPELIDEIFKPNVDKNIYKLNRNVPNPKTVEQTPSQKNMASSQSVIAESAKKETVEKYTTPKKVESKKPVQVKTEQPKVSPRQEPPTKKIEQKTPKQSEKKEIVKPASNSYQITRRPAQINESKQSQVSNVSNASDKKNTLANSKSQTVVKAQINSAKPPTSTQKFKKNNSNKNDSSQGNQKKQDSFSIQSKGKHCSIEETRQNNAQNNLNQSLQKKKNDKKINSPKQVDQQQSAIKNVYGRDRYYTHQTKQQPVDVKIPGEKVKQKNNAQDQSLNQLKKRIQQLMKQNEIYVSQTNRLKSQLQKEKQVKHLAEKTKSQIDEEKNIHHQVKASIDQSDILKRYFELEDAYQSSRMELQLTKNDIIRKKAMIEIANLEIIERNRLIMELRYDEQARTPMMMEKLSDWTLEQGLHSYSRDPVGQIVKQRRKRHRQDCVNFRINMIEQMGNASRMSYQSPNIKRQKQMSLLNFRSEQQLKISKRDLFNSGQRTVMNSGQRYQELESVAQNGRLQKLQLRLKLLKRQNDFLKYKIKNVEQ